MPQVTIEDVAFGGKGIARIDGKVVFVPGAIPGDVVEVEITEDKGRYGNGALKNLINPSSLRGESGCDVFGRCGGCVWRGVDYAQQLIWKQNFVQSAFERIGRLDRGMPFPITGSPSVDGYRNRIHLKGRIMGGGAIEVGYFGRGSHELVAVRQCPIADAAINPLIEKIQDIQVDLDPQSFKIEIQAMANDQLVATLYPERNARESLQPLIAAIAALPEVAWAGRPFDNKDAPILEYDRQDDRIYYSKPGLFQQVNRAANHSLRTYVGEQLNHLQPTSLLDLYCGSGNLSLPFSAREGFEGIEYSGGAIAVARHNQEAGKIPVGGYRKGDVVKNLWGLAKSERRFDVVLTDPPREGMFKGIPPLLKIQPRAIIYVSCDPTTLARDVAALTKKDYRIDQIQLFDFFPNTHHVETVVTLHHRELTTPL